MSSPEKVFVEIAGDELEGGGQITRVTTCLASLLGKPVQIHRIRANRPKPGLQKQHLTGMTTVAALHTGYPGCLTGAAVGSTEVTFDPTSPTHPQLPFTTVEIGTAGSIGLIVQVVLPCLTYYPYRGPAAPEQPQSQSQSQSQPLSLVIRGGTDVSWSPSTHYLDTVLSPALGQMGVRAKVETLRHGFYPKGGGEAKLTVTPLARGTTLKPITLMERGEVESISVRGYISRVAKNIGEKVVRLTVERLREKLAAPLPRIDAEVLDVTSKAFGNGVWVEVSARTTTGCTFWASSMGAFRKPSEDVAKEAADQLAKDLSSGGCMDEYTQDQLLVFMALAEGVSTIRAGEISLHSRTAMEVIRKVSGVEFTVTPDGTSNVITCTGMGYTAREF